MIGQRRVSRASVVLVFTAALCSFALVVADGRPTGVWASDEPNELAGLADAVERDLGLTLDEYEQESERARDAVDLIETVSELVAITGAELSETNTVVYVENERDASLARVHGLTAIVGERETPDFDGVTFYSANDLRGGLPYFFPTGSGGQGSRCSVAFPGVDTTSGAIQFLTAGHCAGNLSATRSIMSATSPGNFRTPFVNIGEPVPGSHVVGGQGSNGGWDHGLVQVTRSGWSAHPEVATWGGGQGAPMASAPVQVRDMTPAIVGAPICKSGGTTGWTCGTILDVNQNLLIGPADDPTSYRVNGIVASICVLPGDSGGAALTGGTAVGVTSASNSRTSCTAGSLGVFAPLVATAGASAATLYGDDWEPLVRVATPVVTVPASSGPYAGSVVRGTVPNGGPRHRVEVVFDGTITRTATVASNGTWEVAAPTGLSGQTKFTVRAGWGQQSVSTPRTGSWWNVSPTRLAGQDRFATAVAISEAAFPDGASAVIIANGFSFPDALSAGPAAVQLDAPVLLAGLNSLPAATQNELQRLNPETIIVVGGVGVVSEALVAQLRSFATSGDVVRLGGNDRYATSRAIAEYAFTDATEAYVADGSGFADALSAGAAGAIRGAPVVLVRGAGSTASAETLSTLSDIGVTQVYVAGGAAVVSNGVAASLQSVASVTRLFGQDRYATSLAINQQAVGTMSSEALLAYGLNFPDALAGSVLAGVRGAPMFTTPRTCVPRPILEHMSASNVEAVTLLGGEGVLSNTVRTLTPC